MSEKIDVCVCDGDGCCVWCVVDILVCFYVVVDGVLVVVGV